MLSVRPPLPRLLSAASASAKLLPKTIICHYAAASFPKRPQRRGQKEESEFIKPSPPPELPPLDASHYPFNIKRTKSNNFPVYHEVTHQGTLKLTRIRHAMGDRVALKELITERLGLSADDVIINNRTEAIVVRGLVRPQVLKLLEEIGL